MGFPLSCAWGQVRWFELPPMMIFHVANAWQEGDLVKVFACCFEEVRARWLPGPYLVKGGAALHAGQLVPFCICSG